MFHMFYYGVRGCTGWLTNEVVHIFITRYFVVEIMPVFNKRRGSYSLESPLPQLLVNKLQSSKLVPRRKFSEPVNLYSPAQISINVKSQTKSEAASGQIKLAINRMLLSEKRSKKQSGVFRPRRKFSCDETALRIHAACEVPGR